MRESDFDEFAEILDATSTMLSRGRYVPNGTSTSPPEDVFVVLVVQASASAAS